MRILVSACLLGENCKYNGGNNYILEIEKIKDHFDIVAICPETFGGLQSPREPSEIVGDRVVSKLGEDVTEQFLSGAEQCLYIAKEGNCPFAILKERSPSCGCGKIYDGTFTGTVIDGNGITAQLLLDNDIQVFGESQIDKAIMLYD